VSAIYGLSGISTGIQVYSRSLVGTGTRLGGRGYPAVVGTQLTPGRYPVGERTN
jgi:hypothetical protein